jgi:uncharacterized membrane protein YecN with MAPEG domain
MSTTYHWPALITLLTMVLLAGCIVYVGRQRMRHRIAPPATTGPEEFVRALRVLMNTVENVVLFLPTLWIAALYGSPRIAALVGAIWLVARVWYAFGYARATRARSMPFMLGGIAWAVLLVIAAWGLLTSPLW